MLPAIAMMLILAATPLEELPASPTVRYIATPSRDPIDHAAVDWVVNTVMSRATVQVPTTVVAGGDYVRIDLAELAPREKDDKSLANLLNLWESFSEPYYTPAGGILVEELVPVAPYKHTDGKTYNQKRVTRLRRSRTALGESLGTDVPVVRYDFFIKHSLSTIEGGLYYKLRGIPDTQAAFLKEFAGVSEADVSALRSDQKYAMFFSEVTAKPRAVLVFRGIGGRTAVNQGLVMITQDVSDDDSIAGGDAKHPVLRLLDNKFTATEIIVELPNGFHAFALFDGNGKRQDAAPDNVVKDHRVPAPYTARLQGAISCIRCHATGEGIQPVTNDVATLFGPKGRHRYLGEAGKELDPDIIDRARSLYSASLDKPFTRARDDYSDAIVLLGSRYPLPKEVGRLTTVQISNHVADIYEKYWYTRVRAANALAELGIAVGDAKDAVKLFNEMIPDQEIEHPFIIALKEGKGISRTEYESIFQLLVERRTRNVP